MTHVLDAVPYPPPIRTLDDKTNNKVADLCTSLYLEVSALQSCIALFDHTYALTNSIREKNHSPLEENYSALERDVRITRNWPFISAREALSALYNFHWALKELNATVGDSSAKDRLPNPQGVKLAYEKFEMQFEKAILARHAASHRTEIRTNFEKNAHKAALSSGPVVKPKGASMLMSDCLIDRTYTGTRKGEILKFEVNWETYKSVFDIYVDVISSVTENKIFPWL